MTVQLLIASTITVAAALLLSATAWNSKSQTILVQTPSTPLDHAELILSRRYARGEISPEQYGKMLVVLHR